MYAWNVPLIPQCNALALTLTFPPNEVSVSNYSCNFTISLSLQCSSFHQAALVFLHTVNTKTILQQMPVESGLQSSPISCEIVENADYRSEQIFAGYSEVVTMQANGTCTEKLTNEMGDSSSY